MVSLAFIGDKLRLPSTGLAVSAEQVEAAPDRVAAMVGVYRRSMQLIFSDGALLRSVLAGTFAIPEPGLPSAVETVRACYNPGGCSEPDRLQAAVDGVAATMGLESRPASELYDFSLAKNGS